MRKTADLFVDGDRGLTTSFLNLTVCNYTRTIILMRWLGATAPSQLVQRCRSQCQCLSSFLLLVVYILVLHSHLWWFSAGHRRLHLKSTADETMLLWWSGSAPDFPEDAADFLLGCWHHTLGHRDGMVLQTICLLLKIVLLATSCGDRRHCNRFGNTSDDFVSGACLLDVNVRES